MRSKKIGFVPIILMTLFLLQILSVGVAAEDAAEGTSITKTEWVNLVDLNEMELEYSGSHAFVDDDKLVMTLWEDQPYQVGLLLEGIQDTYRMSGTIRIEETINTGVDDISGWNGLRIIFGRTDFLNYNTISLYRQHGVHVVNHSSVGLGPLIPYPQGFVFQNDTEFTFVLNKMGRHITFAMNDIPLIDYTLTEEEDFFIADAIDNIGFISINTAYEVSALSVEVERPVETATPEPEPTEIRTVSPSPSQPTSSPISAASATSGGGSNRMSLQRTKRTGALPHWSTDCLALQFSVSPLQQYFR